MPRICTAIFLLFFSGSALYSTGQAGNAAAQTTAGTIAGTVARHEIPSATVVNVVTDCGAVGDGVTDDWSVIQACIDNHPGKAIFFPKMRNAPCIKGLGGGCEGSVDYFVSRTLKLNGNGQALFGESPSRWPGGAVEIKFPRDINGPGIWVPADAVSAYIGNLFFHGQRCWIATDLATFDEPTTLSGVGRDGVLVTGGEATIYGVTTYCFGRHGFAVLGDNAEGEPHMGQPDFWSIQNSFAYGNRGYGLYVSGGDSNAGESIGMKTTGNQLGGIYDHSVLGNTHISPASHADNRNPVPAGAKHPIDSISVEGGVCQLTLRADAKEITTTDTWITVAGASGGKNFDGTYRLSPPAGASLTISYPCDASGGPARGGTIATASSTEIYATYKAHGIPTGAYLGRPGSSVSVWINPYCELNSNAPDFTSGSIVIGRGCEVNVTGDRTWVSLMPGPGWGATLRPGGGLDLDNGSDIQNWLTIRAGRTKDQNKGIRFSGPQNVYWVLGQNYDNYFFITDSQSKNFPTITLNKGGSTDISAPNNSPVRLARSSTGGVQFFGATKEVASVDASGTATFEGVCLAAGVCWNAGRGAPSAAACTHSKGGSLYTRTDGGTGATLYVCDANTGTWSAK